MADNKEVAMLFDSSHCTGCRGCREEIQIVKPESVKSGAYRAAFLRFLVPACAAKFFEEIPRFVLQIPFKCGTML